MRIPSRLAALPAIRRLAAAALLVLALGGCSGLNSQADVASSPGAIPAPTADDAVRGTPIVAGQPGRVFVFGGYDDKCRSLPEPQITITAPPAKGEVSFVPGQPTTIRSSAQGTCIGDTVRGTGIYYTPRVGESGTDRFSISARLASGETATRTFEVQITE